MTTAAASNPDPLSREALVARGRRLELFTIGYNALEAVVSIVAGVMAGSVALVGFGADSVIEVSSAVALLVRLHGDGNVAKREARERLTLRVVGVCFLLLAAYVAVDSATMLLRHEVPSRSIAGIVILVLSIVVMPLLMRAKRDVGRRIGSAALVADAKQTELCAWLSAIALAGLLLNTLLGWWWADPVAALVMVPIIAREGIEAFKGEACDCH